MKPQTKAPPLWSLYGFFLLSSVLLLLLSLNSHWSDSELWSLGISRFFPLGSDISTHYKPLFSALLRFPYFLDLTDTDTVHLARLLFAAFAGGSLLLFFFLAKTLSRSSWVALLSSLLLVSSPLFLSQSYQLRSDLLALFFQLWGLLHFLRRPPALSKNTSWIKHEWGGFLIHFALLLSTPKGIFHFLVNLVFIWVFLGAEGRKQNRLYLMKTFGLPLGAFVVLALWKHTEFLSALRFFLSSYGEGKDHSGFFSKGSSFYVLRFLQQHWYLFFFSLGSLWILRKKNVAIPHALAASAGLSLFFIFFHSDRLPFFIYSLMPMFVILTALLSVRAWDTLSDAKRRSALVPLTLFALWLVVRMGTATVELTTSDSNRPQIDSQKIIRQYLSRHPGTLYYDGTLALPREKQLYGLPAPTHPGNLQETLKLLDHPDLQLVFFGNKMFYYFQEIGHKMEERFFIKVGKIVLAKSYVMLATREVTSSFWKEICERLGHPSHLFVYEGNGVFMMEPLPPQLACNGPPPKISSSKLFLAFSAYGPLAFPDDRSFAEIFDQGRVP